MISQYKLTRVHSASKFMSNFFDKELVMKDPATT